MKVSRGDIEMLLVTVIWGINQIAVKDALGYFLPLQFNVIRLGLAALLLLLTMRLRGQWEVPSRSDWPKIVFAGFLGNTLYQYLFIVGISKSTATNTSFVIATMPVTTALLSHLMGRQKMNTRMWTGVFLASVGVASVIGSAGQGPSGGTLVGDLTTLAGTTGWCLCTIFAGDFTDRMSPASYTTWTMVAGAILLVPFSVGELARSSWDTIPLKSWFELAFSASFALVLCYILWNKGVMESGPAKTAIFNNLTPVWTALFGWMLMGDRWTWIKAIGALVALVGVYLVRLGQGASANARLGTDCGTGA